VKRTTVNVRIYDPRFVRLYRETAKLLREFLKNEHFAIEFARLIADMLYSAKLVDAKQREQVFADLVWRFSKVQEDYYNRGCKSSVVVKIGTVLLYLFLKTFMAKKMPEAAQSIDSDVGGGEVRSSEERD